MKAYTDLEQSKQLAEILPLESADMSYIQELLDGGCKGDYKPYIGNPISAYGQDRIHCWSLAALIDILPKIHGLKPVIDSEECSIQYSGIDIYITASNLVDACVEMILKLHELKMI